MKLVSGFEEERRLAYVGITQSVQVRFVLQATGAFLDNGNLQCLLAH